MTVSGSDATVATVINLMPSTMYIVQVAAINDAGDGVYSDHLSASTNDAIHYSDTTTPTVAMEVTASTAQTEPITITNRDSTEHSATTTVYVIETVAISTGTVPYSETMIRGTPTGKDSCHIPIQYVTQEHNRGGSRGAVATPLPCEP